MKIILHVLLIMACWGCTREPASQGGPGASGAPSPESGIPLPVITYADIAAPDPTVENPLAVSYTAAGGEGRPELFTFRWYVDGTLVDGAKGNILETQNFKKGSKVESEVIPTDGIRMGIPYRTKAVIVKNALPVVTSAVLRPVPAFSGDVISVAAEGTDRDGDTITFEVQWTVNGTRAAGNDKGQLVTTGLKKKDQITAMVTPYDGEDRGTSYPSNYLALSNRSPDITSVPPATLQDGVYVYPVAATDADGDAVTFSLVTAPVGMTIERNTGMIRWQPPYGEPRQQMSVKIAADDGDGGVAYQEFTLNLEMR